MPLARRFTRFCVAPLAVVWAVASPAAPTAVTNVLTKVESEIGESMRTLVSTNWSDGLTAHAGADYLISRHDTIRLPEEDCVFRGNSLQLGTASVQAVLAQKAGSLVFENDGLFLLNANWRHWGSHTTPTITGRVTVLSPKTKPALFSGDAGNDQTGYLFTCDRRPAPISQKTATSSTVRRSFV